MVPAIAVIGFLFDLLNRSSLVHVCYFSHELIASGSNTFALESFKAVSVGL